PALTRWDHNIVGYSSCGYFMTFIQLLPVTVLAFAALKNDGSVVTWGAPSYGGYSDDKDFSGGVKSIHATVSAFAALKADGSVVAWGGSYGGQLTQEVAEGRFESISSSDNAFIATQSDSNKMIWGKSCSETFLNNNLLNYVKSIYSVGNISTLFLRENGSLVGCGIYGTFAPDLRGR
ncbi:MAG: hypothetical protein MK008_12800, partial [Bdellovibrionales bacterium]|nr:hypothetical protein [Bdellovibrionales bacterium]